MSRESIRARVATATEGPWVESGRDVDHDRFVSEGKNPGSVCGLGCEVDGPPEPMLRGQFHRHADAAFIAHARQDIPALLVVADAAADVALGADRMHGHAAGWDDGEAFYAALPRLRSALAALEALP